MSQQYSAPTGSDVSGTAIKTVIPNSLAALLSNNSGTAAPSYAVAFSTWVYTTGSMMRIRNAANNGDIDLFPIDRSAAVLYPHAHLGTLSASGDHYLMVAKENMTLRSLTLVSSTATTSSSGNEHTFDLYNLTQGHSLFSATVGTHTSLEGVGGGSDPVADSPWVLTPDENVSISSGDVIELRHTFTGTPGSLTRVMACLDLVRR